MPRAPRPGSFAAGCACAALTGSAFAGQPGDGPLDPFQITGLPFSDTRDTSGFTDGFDLVCPFSGSTSSDVWYAYTSPPEGLTLAIDICESAYDTKLYVLDGQLGEIACVDDSCSSSGGALFRSNLFVTLDGDAAVFIVVDGYAGENGVFNLLVEERLGPEVRCPDGGVDEPEACGDDVNGGCNTTPVPVLTDVACGDTICGTAWADAGSRDTDWFRLGPQAEPTQIVFSVIGEFDGAYFFLGEDPDCSFVESAGVFPGPEEAADLIAVATGETWWFAGVDGFEGVPCGSAVPFGNDYVVSWSCHAGPPPAPCLDLGDLNQDGFVDFDDLLGLLAGWGECP